MTSPSTFSADTDNRSAFVFAIALAVVLAAFLLAVGLGGDNLPTPRDASFSDAMTSHWPNALFLRRAVLDDGVWPLWRPSIMSGTPFAANPLSKVWYPPQWLVLLLPPGWHLNVLIWLHLVLAGMGARAWARAGGLPEGPAMLAGAGYAFAPRVIAAVGTGQVDLVYAAAWIPWLLWGVKRVLNGPSERRATFWLGIFAALCLLADVRLSAYAFALTAAYALWRCPPPIPGPSPTREGRTVGGQAEQSETGGEVSRARAALRLLAAGLLAAGLSAVQWVPLLLWQADLSRAELTAHGAALFSLEVQNWFGLFFGDHGGLGEMLVYVGISTLTLALAAVLLRPRALLFWLAVVLFAGAYAMGENFILWRALVRVIPPLRWWRVPPRSWFLAALILPYLAAWGAHLLATRPPDRRSARLLVTATLGAGMACGAFSLIALSADLGWGAAIGTLALPLTALMMALALGRVLPPRALLIAFAAIVLGDMLWIDQSLVVGRSPREWLEPYRPLAEYLREAGAVRVYSPTYSLPQQAAACWQIAQFDGVDPFQTQSYVAAAEMATGVRAEGYSVTIPAFVPEDKEQTEQETLATANCHAPIRPDLLGAWLVTHVVAACPLSADGLTLETQIGGVYVYRNSYAPQVTLDWDGPNRVTVRLDEPYSGPLYAVANGRWRDVPDDPPGLPGLLDGTQSEWTFTYDPSEVWLGLVIGAALVALGMLALWGESRHV
ncbi:MAG: hypothetical protein ACUVSU_10860 [Aggregatilineaceae bacterium]